MAPQLAKSVRGSATSSAFSFELAGPSDDAALRGLLAATPTPGDVSLSFLREPDFFQGGAVEGRFRQTIIVREKNSDRAVGLGSRSISPAYLNDAPTPLGYLGSLRSLPEHRGGTLLARGYRFLRELHGDGRTELYLTTIAEGNERAIETLTSGRTTLPQYHSVGRFHTVMLPRRRAAMRPQGKGDLHVRLATEDELPELVRFWRKAGPQRQFFPVLSESDFGPEGELYRGLSAEHILVAWRNGRPVGTLGLWVQRAFRQTVVSSLPRWLRIARPVYNLAAAIRRRPELPAVGRRVSYVTGALPVVEQDDASVFRQLLSAARCRELFPNEKFLAIGLHSQDALLPVVLSKRPLQYLTRVYLACWRDGDALRLSLDRRPCYLELGRL